MTLKYETLTPAQRAAVAMVSMGQELSAEIFECLSPPCAHQLITAMDQLGEIPDSVSERVLSECYRLLKELETDPQESIHLPRGGTETKVRSAVAGGDESSGFALLRNVESRQLVSYLQGEHPQAVALILTQLLPQQAAVVLSELPMPLQSDVAYRIANMERISPEVLSQIASVLEQQFDTGPQDEIPVTGGAGQIAEILNLVDSATEKRILKTLSEQDPGLTLQIKNLMFVFEDIVHLDDRSIQNLLKEIGTSELATALKSASDELRARIFANVSERVAGTIQEEMEFMGPMRLSEVEFAQQNIVEAVRRLEEEGQILIAGRGKKQHVIV